VIKSVLFQEGIFLENAIKKKCISVILKILKNYMEYLKKHLDSIFCA